MKFIGMGKKQAGKQENDRQIKFAIKSADESERSNRGGKQTNEQAVKNATCC